MPPISCTSKGRRPSTLREASLTTYAHPLRLSYSEPTHSVWHTLTCGKSNGLGAAIGATDLNGILLRRWTICCFGAPLCFHCTAVPLKSLPCVGNSCEAFLVPFLGAGSSSDGSLLRVDCDGVTFASLVLGSLWHLYPPPLSLIPQKEYARTYTLLSGCLVPLYSPSLPSSPKEKQAHTHTHSCAHTHANCEGTCRLAHPRPFCLIVITF